MMFAECKYLRLRYDKCVPTENLVGDVLDVIEFEEDVVGLEDFLQVRVAEFSDEVDFIKILWSLVFGEDGLDHADDIGMSAIFEENDLAQDSSGFGSGLKEFDDFFDGNV